MNRAEIAKAIIACEEMAKQLRESLTTEAKAEFTSQGMLPRWSSPDISITASTNNPSVAVVDDEAFLAWATTRHPGEVETVTTVQVRPAFRTALLADALKRGGPDVCDRHGEPIAGVQWRAGGGFRNLTIVAGHEVKKLVREHARQIVAGTRPLELPAETVSV